MSRVQLALNVDDLEEAVTFYAKLFNTAPAKVKDGYANFAVVEPPLKLVLIENPGHGGTINHLGVEVEDSDAGARRDRPPGRRGTVHRRGDRDHMLLRYSGQGVGDGACRRAWEVYTELADTEQFGRRLDDVVLFDGAERLDQVRLDGRFPLRFVGYRPARHGRGRLRHRRRTVVAR